MNKLIQSLAGICAISLMSIGFDNPLYAQCEITTAAPTINNTIETVWNKATSHSISNPLPSTSIPSGFSAKWRSLYNSTNLYFLVEVTKATAPYNGNNTDWWNDDAVEIYIDGDDSRGTTYDHTNDFQFGFRYNDGTVVKTNSNNPSSSTTGISYSLYTTTAGYNVEILIPWTLLAVTPTGGNKIGVDVGVDVSNNGTRATQVLTYDATGHAFENPSLFGEITLASCVVSSIENTQKDNASVSTNPNPYSSQTELTLPAVGSYNIIVSDLKGRVVKEYNVENADKAIITSEGMENGMYVYSVKNTFSNKMYNGKLIVNK